MEGFGFKPSLPEWAMGRRRRAAWGSVSKRLFCVFCQQQVQREMQGIFRNIASVMQPLFLPIPRISELLFQTCKESAHKMLFGCGGVLFCDA